MQMQWRSWKQKQVLDLALLRSKVACISAGCNEIEGFHVVLETRLHILW